MLLFPRHYDKKEGVMYLVGNGRLFTRDENNTYIENGALLIKDNIILELGETEALIAKYKDVEFIDAKNQLIMPAFINVHNHIYSAFARGLSLKNHNPNNFLEILEGLWWKVDNELTVLDSKYSAYATYINCIENGVTTVFDHHASYKQTKGSLEVIANVSKELGLRSCLCYEVSDRNGKEKMQEAVFENLDFINYANNDESGLLKGMMGLHASFTLSDETLDYINSKMPADTGYHVHVAEGIDDVVDSREKYALGVVERLHKKGILGKNTIAGHCIHLSDEEMDILKTTDTMVVHNPESNMGNAVGCPEVLKMFEKGILIGLGTDGYTNDMMESYKAANCLHKHQQQKPNVAWGEIPTMLFENNRKIAQRVFEKPLGMLKENYLADVILVDYDPFTPLNADNLNSHLLFGINGKDVTTTIANGKVLMRDRNLVNIDKTQIMNECRVQSKDFWNRVNN